MNNWTAETRQALDDYLAEVERLALSKGDDAQEIVSGLREHIIQEAGDEAGDVVSMAQLERILARVGMPQKVMEIDPLGARTAQETGPAPQASASGAYVTAPVSTVYHADGTPRGPGDPRKPRRFSLAGRSPLFWGISLVIVIPVFLVVMLMFLLLAPAGP